MASDAPAVRPALPRWFWLLAVGAYVPIVVVLILLALQLEDTRSTVDDRLATSVGRLERATLPLADAVTPAARAANADRPEAKRLTGASLALAKQLGPIAKELGDARPGERLRRIEATTTDLARHGAGTQLQKSGALSDNLLSVDAGRQIQRSGALSTTLLGAGVGAMVRDLRALSGQFAATDLRGTAQAVSATADELNRGTRLRRLLQRMTRVFGQAEQRDVVPSVDAASEAVTRRLVPLVEQGIALLRENVAITRDTNAVTRDTNRHAANLDRKLGGDLPLP